MKKAAIVSVLMAAVVGSAAAQAVVVRGSGGYGYDSPYNRQYDRNRQVQFTGRVAGKVSGAPAKGMEQAMSLVVRLPSKKTVTVDLGPRWFVAQQAARINVGDSVRVIGSQSRQDRAVLARQIINTKNKRVLALRDAAGYPYWVAYRSAPKSQAAADNTISGTVVSTNTVDIDGSTLVGYVLQTPNGNVNILTAPTWFMNRQDYVIRPGAYVQVLSSGPAVNLGNGVVVANSLYTGGNTFVFRNDGVPVWTGFGG